MNQTPEDNRADDVQPCELCGHNFDQRALGPHGCPNCCGEGVTTLFKGKPCFDAAWRKNTTAAKCSITEVAQFMQAHYLGKRPAIVLLAMVMVHRGAPVGCVVYSAPPREMDRRYGGVTWELARLYLSDDVPRNGESWLIAQSVKHIKRHHPEVCGLVSYADPSAGHSGTIYKASNWLIDGRTDEGRKTPRCDYVDSRSGKKYGRRGNVPADAVLVRVPRVSKFRFFLRLRDVANLEKVAA